MFEVRYGFGKVLGNQACPAINGLLHIIALYLKNYLLKKSTQINTHEFNILHMHTTKQAFTRQRDRNIFNEII